MISRGPNLDDVEIPSVGFLIDQISWLFRDFDRRRHFTGRSHLMILGLYVEFVKVDLPLT